MVSILEASCHSPIKRGNVKPRPLGGDWDTKDGPADIFLVTIRHCFQKPVHIGFRPSYPALPQLQHSPPHSQQGSPVLGVSCDVLVEFILPKFRAGTGGRCIATAWMSMPEAAMYKNAEPVSGEHQIRPSRKVLLVQAIPEAMPM